MTVYRVEMNPGMGKPREIHADHLVSKDDTGWLVFYKAPPQGGSREFWRVRAVLSIETVP